MARFGLIDSDLEASDSTDSDAVEEVSYLATKRPRNPLSVRRKPPVQVSERRGRGIVAYTSSSESDSSRGSNQSESDSEEEAHPVGKARHRQRHARDHGLQNLSLWSTLDIWELKQEADKDQTWIKARQQLSAGSTSDTSIQTKAAHQAHTLAKQRELNEISTLLESLELSHREKELATNAQFELRNTQLWESIESAIKTKEAEEAKHAEALQRARAAQEEARGKAEAARKEELARIEQEANDKRAREVKLAQEEKQKEEARLALEAVQEKAASVNNEAKEHWQKWNAYMSKIKKEVLPSVSDNPTWRKACREAKRVITPKIGQLTNSNRQTIEISQQIGAALRHLQSTSSQAYVWGLNHVAKSLIKQAEMEVTARLEVAFPLARLALMLMTTQGHLELADVLMARFVKKCFWITGYYPPRSLADSDASHRKLLGHALPAAAESLNTYSQRMSGILSLYCACILVAPLDPSVPTQYRPSAAWKLLAAFFSPPLNTLEPIPQFIESILHMLGYKLTCTYGKQFTKMWMSLKLEGIDQSKAGFNPKEVGWVKATLVKLDLLLEEWGKSGVRDPVGSVVEP